ncbi:invasin domain 3-containing protein [Serratia marcescens]|uniref:invasin domain 3-containing protein n=3 Tax=Serratia marcescens TaxID=615 RepID=UPI002E0F4060
MNQFRTFAHGFDHLQPGDELDVPAVRATGDASGKKTAAPHEDAQAVKVAGIASQAGSFLANNPNGEAAASIARGMAMGEATKEVQDWLGQFGTARVRLDADQHFSLKNSQLDLLVPVFDRDDTLVFTQGSLHRTDDRTQANLGAGVRWFNDGWMLGGNTFLDYDLSRQHTRLGIGVEYWRDFMKLGANSYLQLSNWKDSPDFSDYKERPANGWDIRAQGWLPALPQLGGKLTYEQYYGDEVGLFGKDHRQKDPHAFTAGIEYTPVPLVTLRAEQRQGKDGENDTRFGVDFRYQLGAPWQQQVDPGAVQAMRSLAGSRHDLVERNNNIVLEYRKKETIRLHAASLVTGYAGEKKSLGVSVNSTHGLDRIDWSAPALLAAGGKIVQDGPQAYSVVLPTYQYAPGINNYTVSGVAVDKKGNRSNTSETQVSVRAPEINKGNSTFTPLDSMLVADGKSTQHLTLSVRDAQGNAVDVPVSEISIDTGNLKSASVSSPVKKAIGEFEVTVTAGVDEEIVTLTPSVSGVKLDTARVAINKAFPSSVNSTFAASPKSIAADNTATSTLTFTAKDADGNLITTLNAGDVSFGITAAGGDASKVTLGAVTKVSDGVFTATLKGTLADTYTIVPAANGTPVSGLSDTVTLTAGTTPDAGEGNSTFAASPKSIAADNTATSTLTFTAKDANGNLITTLNAGDVSFGITAAGGDTSKVTLGAVTKVSDGVFTATLKGTLADTYTIVPAANGTPVSGLSDTVTLTAGTTPDAGEGNSTFAASPKSIAADDTATSTLTFTAKDANGNLITTLNAGDVSFGITAAGGDTSKVTLGAVTKVSDGVFTATLKGTLADTYTIVPAANGTPVSGLSDTVTLTAGTTPDAGEGNSTFAASPKSIAADDTATSTLTFTAKDANGNLITTLNAGDVSFGITAAGGDTSKVTLGTVTKVSDGVFTATLKGTLADTYTIVPAANGTPVSGLSDTVTLTAGTTPDAGEGNSTFAASPKSIAADNTATSTLTFTAKDANGNLITTLNAGDVSFGITAAGGDTSKVTLGAVTKVSDGVFTATLKGTLADTYTIVPAANGTPVSGLSDTVTLTAGTTPDAGEGNSTFAASPKSIVADNTATSTLTFTAKDANGNLITTLNAGDVSFGITAAGGDTSKVTLGAVTKVSDGVFTATLKGTLADTYTIVPAANGTPVSGLSDTVTLTAGTTPDAGEGNSTFAASPKSIAADNTATSTLTFTAKDANGNLITTLNAGDVSFGITAAGGDTSKVTLGAVTKVSDGVFTATLKGTLADTYTIVPAANGTPVSGLSDTVTLTAGTTPDAGEGNSTFAASPKSIAADDTATSTLTFTAKDANGNLITTLNAGDVSFGITAAGGDTSKVTLGTVTKVSDGVFTATLKGTLADTYTIVPAANGTPVSGLSDTVTLTAGTTPDAGEGNSTFAASPKSIAADNTATSTLTFTAKDANGNLITTLNAGDVSFGITAAGGDTSKVTLGAVTKVSDGVFTATLKGTLADTYTIVPAANGTPVSGLSDTVTLTAGTTPDAGEGNSTFAASPKSIVADNTATSTLTFTAKDANGNLITTLNAGDVSFGITAAGGDTSKVTLGAVTKVSDGVFTATLKGTLADTYTIVPAANGTPVSGLSDTVTLTAGTTPDAGEGNSTFAASPKSIAADNTATSTLTFTAKDANGNLITTLNAGDVSFGITAAGGDTSKVTLGAVTKVSDGVFTATLKGTLADTYTIVPAANGTPVSGLSDTVTLTAGTTPDAGEGNSTFAASPKSIAADDTATSTLTFTAKDANGNLITTLNAGDVSFGITAAGGDTSKVTLGAVTKVSDGVFTATLKGTLADTYTIVPAANGTPVSGLSDTVTLTAGTTPDGTRSTFSSDVGAIIPDGTDTATLSFVAKDAYDNAISGLAGLTFVATPSGATLSAVTEVGNGIYTATMTSTQTGSYTVVPQLNGSQVGSLGETISVATVATAVQDILVNGYTYAVDAGFPKTGFAGAKFTVQLNGGEPTDYTWTSSASWASVSAGGEVTFTGKGDSTPVTVTATSKLDPTKAFEYTFTLNDWYINNGSTIMTWSAANTYCTNQGASLATRLQLGGPQLTTYQYNVRGTVGSLWSEWGDVSTYTGSGFPSSSGTWTSEVFSSGLHYSVGVATGFVDYYPDSNSSYVACRQGL